MNRFVIAVRRNRRDRGASLDVVRPSDSITIVEPEFRGVMVIEAEAAAVSRLKSDYGHDLIIEPEVIMSPLAYGAKSR